MLPIHPNPDLQTQSPEAKTFLVHLRQGLWLLGIPAWLFGMIDRGYATFANGTFSIYEFASFLTISFLFVSWLSLKPESSIDRELNDQSQNYPLPDIVEPSSLDLEVTHARMAELQHYHLISQAYRLPFPYLCQIYHLLNLKHLETIHSVSLNNLKVVEVSYLEATDRGGVVKFQTMLSSPLNILRIWRQKQVEAKLTLHNPYMVELGIPVYGDKVIVVLFNAIPIDETEHQFSIDIYSNLNWYRPLLKPILHFASLLTLIEDIPYLQAIAQKNLQRLTKTEKNNSEMMWLFGRFVSLYGAAMKGLPAASTPERL